MLEVLLIGILFYLDNVPPDYKQNCLRMNANDFPLFQLYIWNLCETELRYYRFVEHFEIEITIEVKTENLSDLEKIVELFKFFDIKHKNIQIPDYVNTYLGQGFPQTEVRENDIFEFEAFVKKIPALQLKKILNFFSERNISIGCCNELYIWRKEGAVRK